MSIRKHVVCGQWRGEINYQTGGMKTTVLDTKVTSNRSEVSVFSRGCVFSHNVCVYDPTVSSIVCVCYEFPDAPVHYNCLV